MTSKQFFQSFDKSYVFAVLITFFKNISQCKLYIDNYVVCKMYIDNYVVCKLLFQITNNCRDMALFASTCQKYGLVPIVSVELTMSSGLRLTEASQLLRYILSNLVKDMTDFNVLLDVSIYISSILFLFTSLGEVDWNIHLEIHIPTYSKPSFHSL